MKQVHINERLNELNLLLIFLSGWEEESRKSSQKVFKAWKGYLHEVLDELEARGLVLQNKTTNLLILTEKGKRRAKQLKNKYIFE
jgi:ribosomal protein S19E (S16A)